MAFIPEVIGLMVNNPLIYRAVLNIMAKVEFKQDLCLRVRGLEVYSNTPDRLLASFFWKTAILESYETQLLPQLVKPGMRVVDVGANIGYYSLLLARLVGPTGAVIAFEPDPNNYRLLVKNADCNHFETITAVNKAVADYSGRARLFINRGHRGDHRIYAGDETRSAVEIEATTLDAYLAGKPVNLIKMDIQGAEMLALKGMAETIALNPGLIILAEFSPHHLIKCGTHPSDFLDAFESEGFSLRMIDENRQKVRTIDKVALLSNCSGTQYVNLFLSKEPPTAISVIE